MNTSLATSHEQCQHIMNKAERRHDHHQAAVQVRPGQPTRDPADALQQQHKPGARTRATGSHFQATADDTRGGAGSPVTLDPPSVFKVPMHDTLHELPTCHVPCPIASPCFQTCNPPLFGKHFFPLARGLTECRWCLRQRLRHPGAPKTLLAPHSVTYTVTQGNTAHHHRYGDPPGYTPGDLSPPPRWSPACAPILREARPPLTFLRQVPPAHSGTGAVT